MPVSYTHLDVYKRQELKLNTYDMGKYLLRKAFADDHILPDDILWRQKARCV